MTPVGGAGVEKKKEEEKTYLDKILGDTANQPEVSPFVGLNEKVTGTKYDQAVIQELGEDLACSACTISSSIFKEAMARAVFATAIGSELRRKQFTKRLPKVCHDELFPNSLAIVEYRTPKGKQKAFYDMAQQIPKEYGRPKVIEKGRAVIKKLNQACTAFVISSNPQLGALVMRNEDITKMDWQSIICTQLSEPCATPEQRAKKEKKKKRAIEKKKLSKTFEDMGEARADTDDDEDEDDDIGDVDGLGAEEEEEDVENQRWEL